ncbi:MAG: DUF805 domain-containing protein [Chloroflexota bacterium]|nr:DUF805 domain-containing protein [Chloroflexota bacterium]
MMTIQESVKTCLRKYADFSGRATRAEFWWWVLVTALVSFVINAIESAFGIFGGRLLPIPYFIGIDPLSTIYTLAILLPGLAVTVRRLHDIGRTGWWQLVWIMIALAGFIPVASGIALSVTSLISSGSGWNALGEPAFWIPVAIGLGLSALVWLGLFVWWLIWMVTPGQPGPNIYGPDPRVWPPEASPQADVS